MSLRVRPGPNKPAGGDAGIRFFVPYRPHLSRRASSQALGKTGNILEPLPSNEFMKTLLLSVLGSSLLAFPLLLEAEDSNNAKSEATSGAEGLVEQMRGISMQ